MNAKKFHAAANFPAFSGADSMYMSPYYHQISFFDFNQSCGMQLDDTNEWVRLADSIDWTRMEEAYSKQFPSNTGRPAKPFRMALGALIIQKRKSVSDRQLVKEIAENPYLQYFVGCDKFGHRCPFTAPLLVSFRKRINSDLLIRINDLFLESAGCSREHEGNQPEKSAEGSDNLGTQILDATCSPSNIEYPQDFALLNDGRVKLEEMIYWFCDTYGIKKPRTYKVVAREQYLALAKAKKRPAKKIRAFIRKHLGYLKRDIGYLEDFMHEGYAMPQKYIQYFLTIQELYRQQKYMFDNKTHRVENRIVSISQPWIRPIVRGKANKPVEFGAKYDVSIDEKGHARLEKISFDPYNESSVFKGAVEAYRQRTGHYPARVLVDQIYRTRENRAFCKEHDIRMSGPKLGRPAADHKTTKEEYQDNTDRIEVERFFSVDKRCYGAGLIMTKLEETTLSSIALSVLVANMFRLPSGNIFLLFLGNSENGASDRQFIEFDDAA